VIDLPHHHYSLAFKAKRSTSMCTMVLKEVIAWYSAHGGSVGLYCCMLDATEASDIG